VIAILILFLVGIIRMLLDIVIWAIAIARVRGCGLWLLGALWGTLFQVAVSPVRGSRSGTACRSESEIPHGRGSGSNREQG
jgi:hypothetical protein